MTTRTFPGRRVSALIVVFVGAGCFYDSTWGDAKRAQQNAAAHATPAALSTAPIADDDATKAPSRTLRVRMRATSQYAAQTVDWQHQVRDLVDDANRVLAPAVAAKLEIASMDSWSPAPPDGTLDAYIAALAAGDRATDVDLVVGLVGSIPRHTDSFHDVGLAVVLGKHAVVRAAQSAADYDAIEKGLDELSDEDRKRLRKERQRHRAVAVFLHEIGHVLGAIHEASATSLMHPTYRPTMSAFSDDGALLMRMALAHRGDPDPRALAKELVARIEAAPPGTWIPKDRDDALGRLREIAAREPVVTTTNDAGAAPPEGPDPLAALSPSEHDAYDRANAALQKNHVDEAWTIARPLFEAYPSVYAVQDFRCQLATLRGLDAAKVKTECARMSALLRDKRDGG